MMTKRLPVLGAEGPLSSRFPMPLVPSGWYGLLRSRELGRARPVPIHALGREWVAFRDRAGRAVVVAAHCPHLGAHLGYGGRVDGGELVCPFHAWRFDSTGRCTVAPGAARPPRVALETLPSAEVNGVVFVWFSSGELPAYAIAPDPLHDAKRRGPICELRLRVACHVQELRENVGDEGHFTFVHDRPLVGAARFVPDGPRAKLYLRARVPWIDRALDAEVEMLGPGVLFFRIGGWAPSSVLALTTPIDDRASELRLLIAAGDVLGVPGSRVAHALALKWTAASDLRAEGLIWGHKRYLERPIFLGHERVQRELRAWYRQFYVT